MVIFFRKFRLGFLLLLPVFFAVSCVNTQKAIYFRGQKDSTIATDIYVPETIIQSNDLLSILVSSLNQDASTVFNAPSVLNVSSTTSVGTTNQASGYLVGQDGFISFPLVGNIKAAGLSKDQLKLSITRLLVNKKLLLDPIVTVRILNFKVTVLGEVEHPTVIPVPSERISLLEALGLAGDLTINAKRDNVLVIREEPGKRIIKRIDLNSQELFTSPYYYLKSNDIVYAEPNKARVRNAGNSNFWVPLVVSTLSFGIILLDHIKFN